MLIIQHLGIETSIPDDIGNRIDSPYDVGYQGDGRVLKPGASFYKGIFNESIEDQRRCWYTNRWSKS